jgi:hypothetical protein
MNTVLLVIAAVAVVVVGALLWWRARVGRELALMQATETSKAAEVAGKAQGTPVELKGVFRARALLKGEFSGSDCVYYRALVEREVQRVGRDANGRRTTERSYETVSSTERHTPCVLEDASGTAPVDFEGAKVEGIRSHQRYESGGVMGAVVGSVIGSLLPGGDATLGHRYTEWIIPAGVPVYVLGSVIANGAVGASPTKANPFIISHKSEEERERSLGWTRLWLVAGALVAFVIAAALVYWSLRTPAS